MLSQCQTTFTVSQKRLIDILRGCLDPSTVHVAEQSLKE